MGNIFMWLQSYGEIIYTFEDIRVNEKNHAFNYRRMCHQQFHNACRFVWQKNFKQAITPTMNCKYH
jgi:hypothetical protein